MVRQMLPLLDQLTDWLTDWTIEITSSPTKARLNVAFYMRWIELPN